MKRLTSLTLILSILFFYACNNEKTNTTNSTTSSQITEVEDTTTQQAIEAKQTGDNNLFNKSDYTLYQAALKEGTLTNFFSTSNWKGVFPILNEKPEALARLITGELTIIELEGSLNSTIIVCVDKSIVADNFSIEDAYFTVQISNDF